MVAVPAWNCVTVSTAGSMGLTRRDTMAAFEQALNWQDQGGGAPAKHCAAAALVAMKQFKEGATRLEALAQEIKQAEFEQVRIGALAQARSLTAALAVVVASAALLAFCTRFVPVRKSS